MASSSVLACSKALGEKGLKLALVESATAGRLCAEFSLSPHAGEVLMGGIVCYDIAVKESLLQIPKEIIDKHSPESPEVTQLMALSLERYIKADIHVAITGLTRPGGSENGEKPVGTMFIHLLFRGQSQAFRYVFEGDEQAILDQTIDYVTRRISEICIS